MKNRLLSIILMIFPPIISGAQQVWKVPGAGVKDAIVRSVNDSLTLLYASNVGVADRFLVYDGSPTISSFKTPVGLVVHDVVVLDGVAYFCGEIGGHGVVGFFDVVDAYVNGIADMNYADLSSASGSVMCLDALSLSRLDVFNVGSMVFIAAVGTSTIGCLNQYSSSIILSAFLPTGSSNWDCQYYFSKDPWLCFSDIACLDDLVVVAGIGANGGDCYLKAFHRAPHFVRWICSLTPGFAWKVDAVPSTGPVLLKRIKSDIFVASQFGKSRVSTVLHRLEVSTAGSLYVFDSTSITSPSPLDYPGYPWELHDMAYDAQSESIHLLEKSDPAITPNGFESWLFRFPLSASSAPIDATLLTEGDQYSLDVSAGTLIPVTTGQASTGELDFYTGVIPTESHCWKCYELDINNMVPVIDLVEVNENDENQRPRNTRFMSVKEAIIMDVECQ